MGHFHELAEIAVKVIKFKQGKVMNNEVSYWAPSDEGLFKGLEVEQKLEGACAAITCRFLVGLLTDSPIDPDGFDKSGFSRDKGVSSFNIYNQTIYDWAVKYQIGYMLDSKGGEALAVRNMATKIGLEPVMKMMARASAQPTFVDFMVTAAGAATDKIAIFAGFQLKVKKDGSQQGHALGLGKRGGMIYVFDANLGGYRMEHDRLKLEKFFQTYKRLYEDKVEIMDSGMEAYRFKLKAV